MLDRRTKRLLSASRYGVLFSYADGHRYISLIDTQDDFGSLYESLESCEKLHLFKSKCYGDVDDALDHVDFLLKEVCGKYNSLEESYNEYQNWWCYDALDDEKKQVESNLLINANEFIACQFHSSGQTCSACEENSLRDKCPNGYAGCRCNGDDCECGCDEEVEAEKNARPYNHPEVERLLDELYKELSVEQTTTLKSKDDFDFDLIERDLYGNLMIARVPRLMKGLIQALNKKKFYALDSKEFEAAVFKLTRNTVDGKM